MASLLGAGNAVLFNTTYYQVTALVADSKKSSGYRYSLYKCAMECHAYHPTDDIKRSIYYEEGCNNLSVRLLFLAKRDAEEFQNQLLTFGEKYPHFGRKLTVENNIIRVEVTNEPRRILIRDYEPEDNTESPDMSLNHILSDTSVISLTHDPALSLQAVEEVSRVAATGSKWYRCHLISATNKKYENDPDNVIYASWTFHQHFDGLNTVNGIGLAVRFEEIVGEEEVNVGDKYETRFRVNVVVQFREQLIASVFEALFKMGTQKLSELEFGTFLYAKNPEIMKNGLLSKYNASGAIHW